MSADVMDGEQPAHKKSRLASSTSLDNDDAFNELLGYEPIEQDTQSASTSTATPLNTMNSSSLADGPGMPNVPNGGMLVNGVPSSTSQTLQQGASGSYYASGGGGGAQTGASNPPSAQQPSSSSSVHPPPQQSSVLQELLLQNNHPPGSSMNSPRPYAPSGSAGGPQANSVGYPTRSPMTSAAGPGSVPPNMMSPPNANMSAAAAAAMHQQHQQQQRFAQFQRQQAVSTPNQFDLQQSGAYPPMQPTPPQQMGGPLPPSTMSSYASYQQQQMQQQRAMQYTNAAGGGAVRAQMPGSMGRGGAMMVNGSPAPPIPNPRGARQTPQQQQHQQQMQMQRQMVMMGAGAVPPQHQQQQLYEQQHASPYPPPQRQGSLGDNGGPGYAMIPQGGGMPPQQQPLPMHMQPQGGVMRGFMPGGGMGAAGPPVPAQMMAGQQMNAPHSGSASMMVMGAGGSVASGGMMQMQNGAAQKAMGGAGALAPQQSAQQPPGMNGLPLRGGGLGPANSNDVERRKLIQQQLVLLLHAHKCQQRDRAREQNVPQPQASNCTVPFCPMMKGVLEHMTHCSDGRQCQYAHCASSRQIIMHWKNCSKDDCPVCKPVKSFSANPNDRRHGDMTGMLMSAHHAFAHPAALQSIYQHPPQQQQQQQPTPQQSQLFGPGSVGAPPPTAIGGGGSMTSGGGVGGGGGSAVETPLSSLGAFGSPPTAQAAVNHLLMDYNPANPTALNPFRSTNPPNKMGQANAIGMMGVGQAMAGQNAQSANSLIGLPPDPPSQPKEWHDSITSDLRMHLVSKLVKAIFPSPDPSALQDQRIRDLINYAKKVEKDMFETASDKEEYYHLLAEKIYKIQKELQEKKNRRETQQGGSGGGRMLPDGAPQLCNDAAVMMGMGGSGGRGGLPPDGSSFAFASQQQSQQQQHVKMEPGSMLYIAAQQTAANGLAANDPLLRQIKVEERGICAPIASTSGNNTTSASSSSGAHMDVKPTASSLTRQSIDDLPVEEKIFDVNELRNHLKPVWDKLYGAEEAMPFRVPVDPEQLKIPDYFDIVKNPMDLSKIMSKLNSGDYRNPWEFCDDMWVMFDNAWLYNRKNSKVYKYCTKLSEIFVDEINPVMQQMGYCCGQRLTFTPLPLICYGEGYGPCMIARDQEYMFYETSSNQYGVNVAEKFIYCMKCFENLPPEGINLGDNPSDQRNMVRKDAFKLLKNNQIDYEPFDNCKVCQRRWHRICALHSKKVYPEGFVCEHCRAEKNRPKPDNKFTARNLPHCKLSQYIEKRVNTFIDGKLPAGKKEEVIIRVLCTTEKEVEVRPHMKQKYGPDGFPERFPYRAKAVFAFEIVDGVEVCFFGLHVQEYGSRALPPNHRRVYIAYLDSVHFFQPRYLRTDVYHEILLGYLQYVKDLGFTMAHIWACPPSEGDDYIFHCHPPEQKIPKPKRLQEWYKKMLEKGHEEGTVYEYKDIYKQARDDEMATPMTLPYFEGDYWPNIIEDCIKEAEREEGEKKRQEAMKQHMEQQVDDDDDDIFQTDDGNKASSSKKNAGNKASNKKNTKSKSKQSKKKSGVVGTGNQITDKLFGHLEKHKEVFFTIRLVSLQKEVKVVEKPIIDQDGLIPSELMDGRDTFLGRARDEHWEFSSLRRAKWSTMCFSYALHTQNSSVMQSYECDQCKKPANWHCEHCVDDPGFDLCENCYKEHHTEHPHPMTRQVFSDVGSKSADASANARNESVQRCINSLVHACKCKDANCRKVTCHKMKKVVQHARMCKKRQGSNACAVCKQLIALCCYHAKHCVDTACPVPFCANIRQKLQEQRRMQNRRADMMMRRRMEKMNSSMGLAAPSTASTSDNALSHHHPHPHHQASTSSAHMGHGGGHGLASQQQQMQPSQQAIYASQQATSFPQSHPASQHSHPQQQQQQQYVNGIPPGYQLVNGQLVAQQQGVGIMGVTSSYQQQQHHPGMGPQPMQRVPSTQQLLPHHQQQQQHMNPPPYGRQSSGGHTPMGMPSQHYGGMASNSPGTYSNSPQQMHGGGGGGGKPNMMPGGGGPQSGSRSGMGMSQPQEKFDTTLVKIVTRMNESPPEERTKILAELKKTPHLMAAFLKMTKKKDEGLGMGATAASTNQMMRQQPAHWTAQQQYQQSQQMMGQHPPSSTTPQWQRPPSQQ